jgi:hypothetical protein
MSETTYKQLREVDVTAFVEKKNGLSYLSWAWAVDQLLLRDNSATWEYRWDNGVPFTRIGETAMVFCTVTAFGVSRTAQLPVMNHRNQPIPNPNSFELNTAMQRCLAKAISMHGLGMFLYIGEDLPPSDVKDEEAEKARQARVAELAGMFKAANTLEELATVWGSLTGEEQKWMAALKDARKATLSNELTSGSKPGKGNSPAPRSGKPSASSAVGNAATAA